MTSYTALLVDDEEHGLRTLAAKIEWSKLPIQIIGQVNSVDRAQVIIEKEAPDFIFLDIKMPQKDGFQLLEFVNNEKTDVIFTTAHEDYTLKAFKNHVAGYLLKPIIQRELTPLLKSLIAKRGIKDEAAQIISLKSEGGLVQLQLNDILYIQSLGIKSKVFTAAKKEMVISHHLKVLEDKINNKSFFRIHHQTIVNMTHIAKVSKGRYAIIEMANHQKLEISRSRKADFFRSYDEFVFSQ